MENEDKSERMVSRWIEIEELAKEAGMVNIGRPIGDIDLEDGSTHEVRMALFASPGLAGVDTPALYRFAELVVAYLGKQSDSA